MALNMWIEGYIIMDIFQERLEIGRITLLKI